MRGPRLLLLVVALAFAGAIAAGCGGGDGGGQEGEGGNGGGGGDSANLTVGIDQEPDILNGFIVGGDLAVTADTTQGILDKPYELQPDLTIAPQLADGEPEIVSEDPLTIEYKLKDDLTFSDGEPLTSEDAKFTFNQIMNEDNDIITREGFDKVESFETPDDQTVRITFSEPYAPWKDLISGSYAFILPKHIYEGENFNKALNNEVVGSGPFKLKEWNKGQNLIVEKNENYWGEEPAIDQITYRFIPDTNTLNTSLQSGEVDFINPPADIGLKEKLEGYQGVEMKTKAGTIWEHVAFNLEKIDNPKIREAVAYGINRKQILEEILPGQVEPLESVLVPEQDPYYEPAWEKYDFDPERASQLVEEAKSEGASTDITFSTTSDNNLREQLQQVMQQQLKDVGLTVNIKNTAAQTFFGEWTPEGNFQMGEWAWLATPEPTLTSLFGADALPPDGQNYYRWENEEATELMKQADATLDEAERAELTREVQTMMADELPLIPLYQRPVYYGYQEGLQGPKVNPTLAGPYWNVGEWSFSQ